ncbi:hypothetical protein [Flavobacterium sp. FlaQc-48]|uniref:hypothetical protein n=1 Tax=Flavobacterium sp. FlaQc-48 TaxID=3374181 RepID=UPI0037564032
MDLKKAHYYLYTFCRYFMATMILSYAFSKILGTQFIAQPSTFDKPVGSLSGFELTWYYYSFSHWYGTFIAVSQIISAILLFFRKTTRIGVVLFLTFMVNILLIDFAYHIKGAQGMATILTVMGLFVFFSEFPLFYKYFIIEPPLFSDQETPKWINRFKKIKWVYIAVVFIGFYGGISYLKNKLMGQNEFYGTWQNTTGNSEFERLNFEALSTFQVNKVCNNSKVNEGLYSFTKDSIFLRTFTKKYQDKLSNDKENSILNPDQSQMITLLKGKYQLDQKSLTIQTDKNQKIIFKRIR